jgi:hypothetical protein
VFLIPYLFNIADYQSIVKYFLKDFSNAVGTRFRLPRGNWSLIIDLSFPNECSSTATGTVVLLVVINNKPFLANGSPLGFTSAGRAYKFNLLSHINYLSISEPAQLNCLSEEPNFNYPLRVFHRLSTEQKLP